MKVIFVNRVYWPDEAATAQILTDLTQQLAAAGHEVLVITSQSARGQMPRVQQHGGVTVHRLARQRKGSGAIGAKAYGYAVFLLQAAFAIRRLATADATVVPMTDPPLLGIVAVASARRGTRVIHWIQDVYPEIAMQLAGQTWLRVILPWRNRTWRLADACVTLGSDMARLVRNAGVPERQIHIIRNVAPKEIGDGAKDGGTALRSAWGLAGKFVVAYAGNLGRVHDLDPILDIAEALRHDSHLRFLFVGDGAQRDSLEVEARRRQLDSVSFQPPQPRAQLNAVLAVGDVHLVTLRAGCEGLVFPSKLEGILSAGRPVLFLGPTASDVADAVRESGSGFIFSRMDTSAAAACLRRLSHSPDELRELGVRARASPFTAANQLSSWLSVLEGRTIAPMATTS